LESLQTIIFPFNYLREIIPEQKTAITTTINPDILNKILKDKEKILSEKNISLSQVDVIAILGKTEVLFQDLLYIEPGDIITLDNKLTDPVMVKIEGKTKFLGTLGMVGNKIGIKITKVLTDEESEEYQ
jgi:flagellar motor switch protein FliM